MYRMKMLHGYIKIFTLISREEIDRLIAEHNTSPHERFLQKRLAEEVTVMVHSKVGITRLPV